MPSTNNTNNRGGLGGRLARHFALSGVAAVGIAAASASADIVYYAPGWVIPATTDGLYINVETQVTGGAGGAVAGWDLNPYGSTSITWFSSSVGAPMLRYPGVTTGSAGNLPVGVGVGASGSFGSGGVTIGSAAGNWVLNSDNRFGFRFTGESGQTHYGWGTMSVGASAGVRTITEIAYESTPGVPVWVGDRGDGAGVPYDPCAPFNPAIAVGSNNLLLNRASAPDVALSGCGGSAFGANYFKFVVPLTGTFTFSTCASSAATRIAVVDGCSASAAQLGCNDDACGSSSSVSVSLIGGTTCFLVVGAESAGATLPATLSVAVSGPTILRSTPNWTVPVTTTGLYINAETQLSGTTTAAVTGWDLQASSSTTTATDLRWAVAPGSAGMMWLPGVTTGGAGNLPLGATVGASGSFNATTLPTAVTFGSAAGNWRLNSADNYFGFRFIAASGFTHYGWGRMTIGATAATRTITEIAIRTVPNTAILVGETVEGPPAYNACAAADLATINTFGNNTLAYRGDSGVANVTPSGCGTIFRANFYKFTPTLSGEHVLRVCDSSATLNRKLAVLSGCDVATASVLACDEPIEAGLCASASGRKVTVSLTAGVPVYVVFGTAAEGTDLAASSVAVSVQGPPVPLCASAPAASYGLNAISSTANNPTVNQDVLTNAAQNTFTTAHKVQFLKFTPTATGAFVFKTCEAGDTKLAIGTGCPNAGFFMSTIGYNDDAVGCPTTSGGTNNWASWIDRLDNNGSVGGFGGGFALTQDLVAGETYIICVGAWGATDNVGGFLVIEGPEAPPCPADLDLPPDGNVSGSDLAALLAAWGTNTPRCDFDDPPDGNVSGTDLAFLLAAWGPCAP